MRTQTNRLAIASLVLGIAGIIFLIFGYVASWICGILALIFGYIARAQIQKRGEGSAAPAIAGIVLGWVEVGLVLTFLIIVVRVGL